MMKKVSKKLMYILALGTVGVGSIVGITSWNTSCGKKNGGGDNSFTFTAKTIADKQYTGSTITVTAYDAYTTNLVEGTFSSSNAPAGVQVDPTFGNITIANTVNASDTPLTFTVNLSKEGYGSKSVNLSIKITNNENWTFAAKEINTIERTAQDAVIYRDSAFTIQNLPSENRTFSISPTVTGFTIDQTSGNIHISHTITAPYTYSVTVKLSSLNYYQKSVTLSINIVNLVDDYVYTDNGGIDGGFGVVKDNEISFNTYNSGNLHLAPREGTTPTQWNYSTNGGTSWNNVTGLLAGNGITTILSSGHLTLEPGNPAACTAINFLIKPNGDDSFNPISVHFHVAPALSPESGSIIRTSGDDKGIISFNPTSSMGRYDTIFIPENITSIASGIFDEQFKGTGDCVSIKNVILADREDTMDVGNSFFSNSSSSLVLSGNIYIGAGTVENIGESSDWTYFFSCTYNSSGAEIVLGNVTINADCVSYAATNSKSLFFGFRTSTNQGKITSGDVVINGDCEIGKSTNGEEILMFSIISTTGNATLKNGDVTIDGNIKCESSSTSFRVLIFSTYTSTGQSEVETGDVTINGDCLLLSLWGIEMFSGLCDEYSYLSVVNLGNVAINDCTVIINLNNIGWNTSRKHFFYGYNTNSSSIVSFTSSGVIYKQDDYNDDPHHLNDNTITWPNWSYV